VGERFEVVVGPVAHGGHFVARVGDENRVVFVRHALPGERVVLQITEGTDGDRFWRGDAVEVLEPSPDRVTPPCPYAGPDRCGGCDFQHVALARQRELKAEVVREQLARLAGLSVDVTVEPVPGEPPHEHDGLRWRTRQRYVALGDGSSLASPGTGPEVRKGMRKHRSHDVVEVADCLIAGPPASHVVQDIEFAVEDHGFWQVHPRAPEVLVSAVVSFLGPRPQETVLDLYAGVGLFARFLAGAVGDSSLVTLVEGDPRACAHAETNVPGATVLEGDVRAVLSGPRPEPVDLVVLDPPREGARRAVVEAVAARRPRAVAYVACDPAALARDVAIFAEHGYALDRVRAFDLFPMTHHVECVALLRPLEERPAGTTPGGCVT
jgi:tRNA/tmRNA/rRNA uracil-C5-methylase (TrmA/RlmC/RlmD family)